MDNCKFGSTRKYGISSSSNELTRHATCVFLSKEVRLSLLCLHVLSSHFRLVVLISNHYERQALSQLYKIIGSAVRFFSSMVCCSDIRLMCFRNFSEVQFRWSLILEQECLTFSTSLLKGL